MTKDDNFKLLRIQTFILKVHIHCDGCKQEVKKLLQRIEGVYTVSIDAEHQKVTVSGNVDSNTLIKKLARSGKHAELWTQKPSNQSHKPNQQHQAAHSLRDGNKNSKGQANQALVQGLKAFKNQQPKFDSFSSDDEDYDDDDDEDEVDELRLLGEKMNQLNLLRQANNAAAAAANAKKNGNAGGNANNVAGKKGGGNPNQNVGLKGPNGPDQKGLNAALPNYKMGNVAHLGGGGLNNAGEGRRVSDINGLMAMGGLQGIGGNNGFGFHQAHQQQQQQQKQQPAGNTFPAGFPANGGGGLGVAHQAPVMGNLQAYQNHPSAMMMNSRGLNNNMLMNESRYMQPQMMYNRAPQIPPYTGYYYPYYPGPYPYHQPETGDYGAHLFSDENTSSCAVM